MNVAIINYGMGNLQSVCNAFRAIGCDGVTIAEEPAVLATADAIVLPGVGAFGDGMANLHGRGWVETLNRQVRERGKPFLGLCLGMQLLATRGTEHGSHAGLDWVPGIVDRIKTADPALRVPHIGWNDVRVVGKPEMYQGLTQASDFYFVHSYVLRPQEDTVVNGRCDYGGPFAASLQSGNLWATQYHPEKSQKAGLTVLRNFMTTFS
jgi:imidazole glycerol-phosphate synthase subunit HisH